ncbi:MAG: biotin carboxylase N-terminal domain-containing protein [Terricaulis sp.]
MLKSVLIANRGEIARRIIRTAKRLGVRTVAVYSEADAKALHVREADASVAIGPPQAQESYLRGDKIIAAAKETGAEAIHPGYGFLSENADFAQAVLDAGLIWIGPTPHAIRAMGLKDAAKKLMSDAGVPVTPGYLGDDQSEARLVSEAEKIGYPVLIKAVAGGGGKGMRKVEKKSDFKAALASAKRESAAAFGDDRVLLETYVQRPRHIEVQVFGDAHGNIVHMFERDCSLQRRHQKVIEEAPAPGMDDATRAAICAAALRAAAAVNYVSAGTVEFIADASEGLRADRIWFMEMNTRLQVEHPVTEEITGLDLVEWQLRVASGEALPLRQEEITMTGHAIEARLYAENPETGFLPSVGGFVELRLPYYPVRLESAFDGEGEVSAFYDPMIAKIITRGANTRAAAIAQLRDACAEVEVWPVKTNAGFLVRCLDDVAFGAGDVDTGLIGARGAELTAKPKPSKRVLGDAAVDFLHYSAIAFAGAAGADASPWARPSGFRLNAPSRTIIRARLGEQLYELEAPSDWADDGSGGIRGGDNVVVEFENGEAYEFILDTGERTTGVATAGDGAILSPMPGKIVSVSTKPGARVAKGDALLTLEAMKMEHALVAPFAGKVSDVKAKVGDQVSEGVVLVRLEAE